MTHTERFKIVMDILCENDLCNNSINHGIFRKLCTDDDLENKTKIAEVINVIKKYEFNRDNNINKYPENIMECLRQRRGLESFDISEDCNLNEYTSNEAFEEVCNWNGLVRWGYIIKGWVKDIYGIDLDEIEKKVE
jgi:hypothetical protein